MACEKIHNKGQAKLFNNRYVEYFTKTHPLVIGGIYLPVIIGMVYYSTVINHQKLALILSVFVAGVLFWTFFEYTMHRFAFHFISENKKIKQIVYIFHGNHHEYPRDKNRLFMPALPSIIIALQIFLLMYLTGFLLGINKWVLAFFPGFMLGYLIYGTMHYAIHAWNPPYKWMKPLWRNHHLHHYKNEERGFGVSTTLWDRLFGTMYDLDKEKENKEKVQELMF
ncbi:sterol desaturase family protein [Ferruginibacter paludis]|uniref:sterol desaturase family protein n=1 Tax=Ferruginibacter paludis TaxID=1310417 RepID=UPI0025B3C9D0|nr:sterol desaturase family protein [Ferruginibacter paludis]MDN3656071.1 sterol desaturase family protein [Ferruginibacter paludis]